MDARRLALHDGYFLLARPDRRLARRAAVF